MPASPDHDRAFILSTGDEIVVGQLQDTNARWLADQLMSIGVVPVEHAAVGDSLPDLVETLRRAVRRAPLVVMSGGLGPTDGDLTRAALCELLGEPLVVDDAAQAAISTMLTRRGREVSERQLRQAQRPRSAVFLPNAFGTAPGLHVIAPSDGPHGQSDVLALPGPPGELQPMFERDIRPRLRPPAGRTVLTRLAHIVGIAEADCVTRLGDLTKRDRTPLVGITASGGILTLRMRYEGQATPPEAQRLVDAVQAQAAVVLGDHLFATGPGPGVQHLASTLIGLLKHRRQTLAVVESCTGGLLGETLTEISGASAAFAGGFITYANELKIALGVDATALATHGAVSEVVASQMAARARERTGSHYALSITGIAGPDGGTEAKPVGTVHIGLATAASANVEQAVHTRRFLFTGDRVDIRRRAAVTALAMLYFHLQGHAPDHPRLLWETTPRTESASMAPSS